MMAYTNSKFETYLLDQVFEMEKEEKVECQTKEANLIVTNTQKAFFQNYKFGNTSPKI